MNRHPVDDYLLLREKGNVGLFNHVISHAVKKIIKIHTLIMLQHVLYYYTDRLY